jgi:hypothetical protein
MFTDVEVEIKHIVVLFGLVKFDEIPVKQVEALLAVKPIQFEFLQLQFYEIIEYAVAGVFWEFVVKQKCFWQLCFVLKYPYVEVDVFSTPKK